MKPSSRLSLFFVLALLGLVVTAAVPAAAVDPAGAEFFEKEIRPLLVARCQSCHAAGQARGGLRLTAREALLKGGGRGPALVPGQPERSLLLAAVEYRGELKMPPTGRLPERESELLKRWIAAGAPWPPRLNPKSPEGTPGLLRSKVQSPKSSGGLVSGPVRTPNTEHRTPKAQRPTPNPSSHWAFQPLRDPAPPAVPGVSDPIDRFIRAGVNSHHLTPAPAADPRMLIRRAIFDLTGLPPTPEEVEAFVRECALEETNGRMGERENGRIRSPIPPFPHSPTQHPSAYSRLLDRLLASPAYGVRYARHWLDVIRYADYHDGDPKARTASCEPLQAWRYRDWVVSSLNRDLPFDRFITHQIAGDLLPSPDGQEFYADGLVATTFLTNGSWDRGDADKEKMVSDMVDDQIDTVGKAFLGLTLGCARCHNHKFDPISQADYYALAGIFYSTHILQDLGTKGGEYTLNRVPLAPKAYVERRNEQLARFAVANRDVVELDKKSPRPPPDDPERVRLTAERDRLFAELPPEPPLAEAAQEGGTAGGLFPKIQDVPIHIRGSYTRLAEVVPRRMPAFFAGSSQPPITQGSGRKELAAWIASKRNPLTARVIVNRVWQWHFGAGLVRTSSNFGKLGEAPSHPALLDWLASRFIEDGWSLKELHRRIMLSATYRQASEAKLQIPNSKSQSPRSSGGLVSGGLVSGGLVRTPNAQHRAPNPERLNPERSPRAGAGTPEGPVRNPQSQDPENRWLARFTPRRLEAEAIRDSMLAVSGSLDPTLGGPASAELGIARRSLYVQTARWDRSTFAMLFDAANPDASEEKRAVSTVAPQALFLLNHDFVLTQARRLAERLARDAGEDDAARLRRAYELLFARPPTAEEMRLDLRFLRQHGQTDRQAAWQELAHVLLCSNEFAYLD